MSSKARRLCPAGVHQRSPSGARLPRCGACAAATALDDAVDVVADQLPALTAATVRRFVAAVAKSGETRRELAAHLRARPDALRSGDSDVAAVVARLVGVLVDAGVDQVVLLRCVVCTRSRRQLQFVVADGRVCLTCHQRQQPEPCRECGRTARVAGRDASGKPICGNCRSNDASTWQPCSHCGQVTQVVVRVDGQPVGRCCYARPVIRCTVCGLAKGVKPWKTRRPVCVDCQDTPAVPCSLCGRDAPVPDGGQVPTCAICRALPAQPCHRCGRPTVVRARNGTATCPDCYQRPTRACGRCGRVRATARLARDGDPDLCAQCWTGPTTTCESCGEVRPCRGERRQRMLCTKCAPFQPQTCAHCGRSKRVAAQWIEGPLCAACYQRALAAKATCPACGAWRRLRLYPGNADKICSDCAGAERHSTCRTCGVEDCLYDKGRCPRCALHVRLTAIFGDQDQPSELQAVHAALNGLERPKEVIRWLQRSKVTGLLRRFATGELPATFEAIDALPRSQEAWFVEHLLTTAGVLPGRDPVLARLELWVAAYLDSLDVADHERIIRRYATWHVLRRSRTASARRPLSDNAHNGAKTKIRAAHQFLQFLASRNRTITDCRQADLDTWAVTGARSRCQAARPFFAWATCQQLAPKLDYPPRLDNRDPNVVFGDGEWAVARHLLHDPGIDTHDRVAGLLVVLYAQNATRISQLTANDVSVAGTVVSLRLGVTPLRLPPPMDDHVQALLEPRPQTTAAKLAGDTDWLFPGHHPGRHIHPHVLSTRLQNLGVFTSTARPAALAHLAATMPAAIVADLLGISAKTATTWADAVARSRTDYAAHR